MRGARRRCVRRRIDPAEAGSVGFATTCDAVLDAANGNQPPVLVEVVSAVGVEGAGPVAGAADTTPHGWDAVQ
jgi:hypothetical protein